MRDVLKRTLPGGKLMLARDPIFVASQSGQRNLQVSTCRSDRPLARPKTTEIVFVEGSMVSGAACVNTAVPKALTAGTPLLIILHPTAPPSPRRCPDRSGSGSASGPAPAARGAPAPPGLDDARRRQARQAPQPQAGRLGLGMPELPGLDRLRRRRDVEEPPDVPEHDRVLDRDPRDRRREHGEEERRRMPEVGPAVAAGAVLPAAADVEMLRPAVARGRCTAGGAISRSQPSCRTSRTSPTMCGPARSDGSRSQDTASCPRARKASRTTPENSQATRTRMASRGGRLARALRSCGLAAPRRRPSRSAFTAAKLRPSPSSIASRPVSACQRSTATST